MKLLKLLAINQRQTRVSKQNQHFALDFTARNREKNNNFTCSLRQWLWFAW